MFWATDVIPNVRVGFKKDPQVRSLICGSLLGFFGAIRKNLTLTRCLFYCCMLSQIKVWDGNVM